MPMLQLAPSNKDASTEDRCREAIKRARGRASSALGKVSYETDHMYGWDFGGDGVCGTQGDAQNQR